MKVFPPIARILEHYQIFVGDTETKMEMYIRTISNKKRKYYQ